MKQATHYLPGLTLTDHTFALPLNHATPQAETIDVFARLVTASGRESADLPWLVFLQGGPGFASPRPLGKEGWLKRAVQDYDVLLLDQRGTGRSTPVTAQTLARFDSPEAIADYLKWFRADSIVRDAEWIRRELLGNDTRWTALGQSYGGFCITTYLSFAPEGLDGAIITGGLAPISQSADDVYRATYRTVSRKNEQYYQRYPGDVERAQDIAAALDEKPMPLPAGGRLTLRRFQQLGLAFGGSDGFEQVHYLLRRHVR